MLDDETLLAVAANIDLNPLAADVAATPEDSKLTSLRARLEHAQSQGVLSTLQDDLSTKTDQPAQEDGPWLAPINDRRESASGRVGLVSDFTLSGYLCLVDTASRWERNGKACLLAEAESIFARWGLSGDSWRETFEQLHRRSGSTLRLRRAQTRPTTSRHFPPRCVSPPAHRANLAPGG